VVFHARLAEEHDVPWGIDDVAGGIVDKLVARHPHVFGDAGVDVLADTPAHVEARWDELKKAEKGRTSAVDGVPLGQPALALAAKLMGRVERAGLDVPVALPLRDHGVEAALTTEDELGNALLGLVFEARAHGLDAERALRSAARRYVVAVHEAEGDVSAT
jgi:XTP/dITP diphosphohydrolase